MQVYRIRFGMVKIIKIFQNNSKFKKKYSHVDFIFKNFNDMLYKCSFKGHLKKDDFSFLSFYYINSGTVHFHVAFYDVAFLQCSVMNTDGKITF